jgi:hypothetical protein
MFRKIISAAETETQTQQASYNLGQVDGNTLIKLRNPDGRIIAGRLQENPNGSKTILALSSAPLYYAQPLGQNADGQTYKWFLIDPFSGKKQVLQNILALHNSDLTKIVLLDTDSELFDSFSNYGSPISARELEALTRRSEKSLFAFLLDLGKRFMKHFFKP